MTPKRTDFHYLVGWFLPECKGNHRLAKQKARQYRAKRGLDTDG